MHVYMESREMVLMNLLQGRSGDAGVGDGLVDMGDGGMNGESSIGATPSAVRCQLLRGVCSTGSPARGSGMTGGGGGLLRREGIYI